MENLLRHEDGVSVSARRGRRRGKRRGRTFRAGDRLPAGAGPDAGLHGRARRRRPGGHAGRHPEAGGAADRINPLQDVDLVIDHSVQVDEFGTRRAFAANVDREFDRNLERYLFLKWGQQAFDNFRVVPPGTGIVHQVNLEYLAKVVFARSRTGNGSPIPTPWWDGFPHDHDQRLGVVGWGVGGIEAEAAMLGQPVSMLIRPWWGSR